MRSTTTMRILALALSLSGGVACDDDDVSAAADAGGPDGSGPSPTRNVTTFHNDNQRTGAQLTETILTPAAVRTRGLRLVASRPVDKAMDTQALYVAGVDVDGTRRDLFFVATMGNSVFAYDANDPSPTGSDGALVWAATLTDPEPQARPFARGIWSTPTIDVAARELYVVYQTKDQQDEPITESNLDVAFWLTALDLGTGEVKRRVRVAGSVMRDDGTELAFLARNHRNRPALLLSGGTIYLAFGMRRKEELIEYHGWVLRFDAATFAPRGAFCTTPNSWDPLESTCRHASLSIL